MEQHAAAHWSVATLYAHSSRELDLALIGTDSVSMTVSCLPFKLLDRSSKLRDQGLTMTSTQIYISISWRHVWMRPSSTMLYTAASCYCGAAPDLLDYVEDHLGLLH